MKNHIAFKFLAIVLAACCLLVCVASGVVVSILIRVGLYDNSVDELQQRRMREVLDSVAEQVAARYAAANLSNCPAQFIDHYYGEGYLFQLSDPNLWYYTLEDDNGQILTTNYISQDRSLATPYEFVASPTYPFILKYQAGGESLLDALTPDVPEGPEETAPDPQDPTATEPVEADYLYTESYSWEDDNGDRHNYTLGFRHDPSVYLVTVYVLPGAYAQDSSYEWDLLHFAYGYRYTLFIPLVLCLLLFAVLMVYLCCAAGRSPNSDRIRPSGLNMLPLDLYAVLLALGSLLAALQAIELAELCFSGAFNWGAIWMVALLCGMICVMVVAFCFSFAAQLKVGLQYICMHSLTGTLLLLLWRILRWLVKWLSIVGGKLRKAFLELYSSMPMIWQWLVTGAAILCILICASLTKNIWLILIAAAVCMAVVIYGARCFGILLRSTREMSRGDLARKVETDSLIGCFRDFAGHLDALAGVAVVAAQKQMRSERMKAELVTNVSHDIKTPLTSIINYVDLLQNARSEDEAKEYLEVLDRQSQRLKKLIDDLMEMSKASTGNMSVDIIDTDAVETVNQALGEFSDKLEASRLTAVFQPPEEPVRIWADGRLTWRVLSNLLVNAVKYAMPGTRLYVDVVKAEGTVLISLKNISAEPLNVSSDELMERFVRGDASRHTEGSGLGLNIAKSLMELQHGQLKVLIDGDLFKATLVFPSA